MIFGGFAELGPTVRFAATGRAEHEGEIHVLPSDPLNLPVVALHLLPYRSLPGDRGELERALRQMVYRSWGRMELKRAGARDPIYGASVMIAIANTRGETCRLVERAARLPELGEGAGDRRLGRRAGAVARRPLGGERCRPP